jgi:hypothetical protein
MKLSKISQNLHTGIERRYIQVVQSSSQTKRRKSWRASTAFKRHDKVDGYVGAFFLVEEIYLQENEYDEESEWINGGGIWNFASELNIDEIE